MTSNVTINWDGDKILRAIDRAQGPALLGMANVVANQTKDNLSRRGATRKQIRRGRRAIARSERRGFTPLRDANVIRAAREAAQLGDVDPPGGMPRLRTGNLRRSVQANLIDNGKAARMGVGSEYAAIHEFGGTIKTRFARIKIPRRPYVRPALKKTEQEQINTFTRLIQQAIGIGDGP